MAKWSVETTAAAEAELKALPADMIARFVHIADMLEELGPHKVGMPHVKHLQGKLWEIRMKGRAGIARAVYFVAEAQRLLVVRVFVKKTEKTPKAEIDLALKRMKEISK